MQSAKHDIIQQLKKEVLSMERLRKGSGQSLNTGLWEVEKAFPNHTFPLGAVHEFISNTRQDAAATNGFMTGLLSQLPKKGMAVWVSNNRTIYPPALKNYGIEPNRIIFIDVRKQKEALWAIEESLKCDTVTAVIGEISELSFTESRRLQLVVEQSNVTGFIHRYAPRSENITACISRWKISPVSSSFNKIDLPGVGFSRWNVQLLKVRNGKPGTWQVEWAAGQFRNIARQTFSITGTLKRKTG